MLKGAKAQFPDHLNEGLDYSCSSHEVLRSKKPGGWGDFCDLKWNLMEDLLKHLSPHSWKIHIISSHLSEFKKIVSNCGLAF